MYPQGVCRIRKPACAGNGCVIFPTFEPARIGKKIRYPAADDLFRVSLGCCCRANRKGIPPQQEPAPSTDAERGGQNRGVRAGDRRKVKQKAHRMNFIRWVLL